MASTSATPNTTTFMDQRQCPLFKLARELRDEIYGYYTYDEQGLAYDYASRTLKYANGRDIELAYTCKLVADEMRGVHLRMNVIKFTPSCEQSKEEVGLGLPSRASRFASLLYKAHWTKMVMLHYAFELVTEDDIEKVIRAYSSISGAFRPSLRAIRRGIDFNSMSSRRHVPRDIFTASFCDAVQYTLDLISTHPKFEGLVSKACDLPERYPWEHPPFMKGLHRQVLAWRPHLWQISSLDELSYMETLLTVTRSGYADHDYEGVRYYFSATAICIATLGRLPLRARKQLRSIILQEDRRSVGNPEVHAEGLIPFCIENPQMRILTQTGFHTMLAPSFWSRTTPHLTTPSATTLGQMHNYMRILVDWLIRTAALPSRGMPTGSFAALLDLRSEAAASVWEYLERGAAARAFLPQAVMELMDGEQAADSGVLTGMFSRISRLPICICSVMTDITNKSSVILLDVSVHQRSQHNNGPTGGYLAWSYLDWALIYRPMSETINFPGDSDAYFESFLEDSARENLWPSSLQT